MGGTSTVILAAIAGKLRTRQPVQLALTLAALLPLTLSGAQDIQLRFERSLKEARSIPRVEIHMLDTMWLKTFLVDNETNGRPFFRTFEYTYVMSDQKYRNKCRLIAGSKTNLVRQAESGFDAATYFNYIDQGHYLNVGSQRRSIQNGEIPDNLLIMPFRFLEKQGEHDMPVTLRLTEIASPDFADGLLLPDPEATNGTLEIKMPGLPIAKQPTSWRITLPADGNAFNPTTYRWTVPGGAAEMVWKLLNYTNLAGYRFPTRIERTQFDYPVTSPPSVTGTGLTTIVSVRTPDEIPDSAFQPGELGSEAETIWNSDR